MSVKTTEGSFEPTPDLITLSVPDAIALTDVAPDTGTQLLSLLEQYEVSTLADLREQPALMADDAPAAVQQALQQLVALARFEVVSTDLMVAARAVALGISSPQQLTAQYARESFVALVSDNDEAAPAAALFYDQVAAVNAVLAALRLDPAALPGASAPATTADTTVAARTFSIGADPTGPLTTATGGCECTACRSAVGPTAYLAALLNYATQYFKQKTDATATTLNAVSAADLQSKFHQPFCSLPISCQSAETQVCKFRLAVEVLRKHFAVDADPNSYTREYLQRTYDELLAALGTSANELQSAQQHPEEAPALAKRLGVSVSFLATLQLEYNAATETKKLTEARLEALFGLASTNVKERNPLSDGPVRVIISGGQSGLTAKVLHWTQDHVSWFGNTDVEGNVHGFLELDAQGVSHLRLSRSSSPTDGSAVVARAALQLSNGELRGVLQPQGENGLSGTVALTLSSRTTADHAAVHLIFAAVPTLTANQLLQLEQTWRTQDALPYLPLRDWNDQGFVIDPEVIGPDDLRPLNKTGAPGPAFRIWVLRHRFLQDAFIDSTDSVAELIRGLATSPLTYSGPDTTVERLVWPLGSDGTVVLMQLCQALESANADTRAAATEQALTIGLGAATLLRLRELYQREQQSQQTTDADLREAMLLVRDSVKHAFAQDWHDEEADYEIYLYGNLFQQALSEPTEGDWAVNPVQLAAPAQVGQVPLVDPDVVTPLQLPDAGFGDAAHQLWRTRREHLTLKRAEILAVTGPDAVGRADAMFQHALQAPPPPRIIFQQNDLPEELFEPKVFTLPEELAGAYFEPTALQHALTVTYVEETLGLTAEEFRRLLTLRQAVRTSAAPAPAQWADMAALLTQAWKRTVAYHKQYFFDSGDSIVVKVHAGWVAQEQTAFAAFNSLLTAQGIPADTLDRAAVFHKQRLTPGRALPALRARWAAALEQAFCRPLVDPDQLLPSDFCEAAQLQNGSTPYRNPAYNLFAQRTTEVRTWSQLIYDTWDSAESVLKVSRATIEQLYQDLQDGGEVDLQLRRLNLTVDGLRMLIGHLNNNATEPHEVVDLLTQVQRARHYAAWQVAEQQAGIINSPRYFRLPTDTEPAIWQELSEGARAYYESDPADNETSHLPWRTSAADRYQWRQQLLARYAQVTELRANWQQSLQEVEDSTMPLLRDRLIEQLSTGSTQEAKRQGLTERFYLDFALTCCQYTSRVGQAIEVLQKLIFEHRHGEVSTVTRLKLMSVGGSFDKDWQWLGSFERWRSLMFLYLYPENMLLPTLQPEPTDLFQQLISETRTNGRLSIGDAERYFQRYEQSLRDTLRLDLVTSLEVSLDSGSTTGGSVLIQLARGENNRLYWNKALPTAPSATETNWVAIPVNAARKIVKVIGATVFSNRNNERFVYAYTIVEEKRFSTGLVEPVTYHAVAMQRLHLATMTWDADLTVLNWAGQLQMPLTGLLASDDIQLLQSGYEYYPPVLVAVRKGSDSMYNAHDFTATDGKVTRAMSTPSAPQSVNDFDLIWARMDPATNQFAAPVAKTISYVNDIVLLSGIQLDSETMELFFGLKLGANHMPYKLTHAQLPIDGQNAPHHILDRTITRKNGNDYVYLGAGIGDILTSELSDPDDPYSDPIITYSEAYYARQSIETLINNNYSDYIGLNSLVYRQNQFLIDTPDLLLGAGPLQAVGTRCTLMRQPNLPSVFSALEGLGAMNNSCSFDVYLRARQPDGNWQVQKVPIAFDYREYFNYGDIFNPSYWGTAAYYADAITNQTAPAPTAIPVSQSYLHIGPVFHTRKSSTEAGTLPAMVYQLSRTESLKEIHVSQNAAGNLDRTVHVSFGASLPALLEQLTSADLAARRTQLQALFTSAASQPAALRYLREAYYLLPMYVGMELQRSRNYEEALRYFRLVYDYTLVTTTRQRFIYPALSETGTSTITSADVMSWLADPTNPHTLAGLRPGTTARFVVTTLVRCLIAYADEEFARDSAESVARATSLYELALRLLNDSVLATGEPSGEEMLATVDHLVSKPWQAEWEVMKFRLVEANQDGLIPTLLSSTIFAGVSGYGLPSLFADESLSGEMRMRMAWETINAELALRIVRYETLCQTGQDNNATLLNNSQINMLTVEVGARIAQIGATFTQPYVPMLDARFCIPANSLPASLRLQAKLNLAKIRSCRNIAGVQRELEPYGTADIGVNGLVRPTRVVVPPVQYRYSYLLERTKQIISLAQQAESALLSALEKRDAEEYNLLKARQDIGVSRATVRLQDLRTVEAADGIDLAGMQLDRSRTMEQQYGQWISAGLNGYERKMLTNIKVAGAASAAESLLKGAAGMFNGLDNAFSFGAAAVLNAAAGAAGATAAIANMNVQLNSAYASYERRNDEWKFQRALAQKDIVIGNQQIVLAKDRLQIVEQEKVISELQLDNAEAVLNFLTTKFTNAELYDWMSQILEAAYSYFLQQATATARLAEQQLAFERQEMAANIIQEDYWTAPTTNGSSSSTDRKGLTGSTRLLEDLTRLDQYAFETNRRKLQLTKTISLAQLFPAEFAQFRETGVLPFALMQRLFDQDFPGQYLRTIRRVRTSVIALVPPTEGIKARLTATGISRVVVPGGRQFQTVTLIRQPEAVALTSPLNASGLFELEQQPTEMLYPFEGMGVESTWSFSLQKAANPFAFDSIADVLLTIDYSAYESPEYAQQVQQQLGTRRQQVLTLSLRNQFADEWYDLHHPGEVADAEQYVARITLTPDDLPRHLRNTRIKSVSLYVEVGDDAQEMDHSGLGLQISRGNAPAATALTNRYGLVSTRSGTGRNASLYNGNAVPLLPLVGATPTGEWTIRLDNAPQNRLRRLVDQGQIDDIYLLLEVDGDAPAYQPE